MTNPTADILSTAAKEIVNQAQALGLTWTLRPATISISSTPSLTIVFDGDTVAISAVNITGRPVIGGDRVYGLIVPTIGNFIVGFAERVTPVGVAASSSGAQALPNNTTTPVSWVTRTYNGGGFLNSVPSTFIVVPGTGLNTGLSGVYAITANALLSTSGTRNFIEIAINGGLFVRSSFVSPETFNGVSGTQFLEAGTLVTVNVVQNSGGAATMSCSIWMYRID